MWENRLYGSAGGGARERSPYPHQGLGHTPTPRRRLFSNAL